MITAVNKVMTSKLVTVLSGTSVQAASDLMTENRIRHLPVRDQDGNIIGIISQRDVSLLSDAHRVAVDWIMSSPVSAVNESEPLRKAVFKMLQQKISCLLVINEADDVLGIVTTDDLLWYLSHLLADETEEQTSYPKAKVLETIGQVATKISDLGI